MVVKAGAGGDSPKKSPSTKVKKPRSSPGKRGASGASPRRAVTSAQEEEKFRVLDFSGQGLTTLPVNIYQHRETVREILLFSNNLRALPPDLRRFKFATKLDLRGNGIKCVNNEDSSGFPLELAQLAHLRELILAECGLRYVPPAVWRMTSLLHLDISRNRIRELPAAAGNLYQLQVLKLQHTDLTTLPNDIVYCEDLQELYLWGNKIDSLPETMVELHNLRILAMDVRRFTEVVSHDPFVVSLLKKGQIKSEHVPQVLYEIPNLETLDLEKCMVNTIPLTTQKNAKNVMLNRNFFYTLPECINDMLRLEYLNLSENFLTDLPEELNLPELQTLRLSKNEMEIFSPCILKLPKLEHLYLDHNKIRNLPHEIGDMTTLTLLNLESNAIARLPESICKLVNLATLDLSRNKLKALPLNLHHLVHLTTCHTFKKFEHSGLWLFQNPLQLPPQEIWKTDNTTKIYNYLRRLQIAKTENLVRQKMIVLGARGSGKSSFIKTLSEGKAQLTNEGDNSYLMKETRWRTRNDVDFIILELAGSDEYQHCQHIFLDSKAIYVILYDQSQITEETFQEQIGRYVQTLQRFTPGAVLKLVATRTEFNEDTLTKRSEPGSGKLEGGNLCETVLLMDAPVEAAIVGNAEKEPFEEEENVDEPPEPKPEEDSEETPERKVTLPDEKTESSPKLRKRKFSIVEEPGLFDIQEKSEILDQDTIRDKVKKIILDHKKNVEAMFDTMKKKKELLEEDRFVLKRLASLSQTPLKLLNKIASVEIVDSRPGFDEFECELEAIVVDKELTPFSQRYVPGHWLPFRAKLNKYPGYFMSMEQVKALSEKCGLHGVTDLDNCLHHLHDTGDIIWLQRPEDLREMVFHKPGDLVNLLSCVYRHDIETVLDFHSNHTFISAGQYEEDSFEKAKELLFTEGKCSNMMLKCLWFYLRLRNQEMADICEVLSTLGLMYNIPIPESPSKDSLHYVSAVLPWYNTDKPQYVSDFWPGLPGNWLEYTLYNMFPVSTCQNVFQQFIVRIQDLVWTRLDFSSLVFATRGEEQVLVQQARTGADESPANLLELSVRGEDHEAVEELFAELRRVMFTLLQAQEGLVWNAVVQRNFGV